MSEKDERRALERESAHNGAGTLRGMLRYLKDFGSTPSHVVVLTDGRITAKYEGKAIADIASGKALASAMVPKATDRVGDVLLVFAPSEGRRG